MSRKTIGMFVVAVVGTVSAHAQARSTKGAFQLGVSMPVLSHSSYTAKTASGGNEVEVSRTEAGFGEETTVDVELGSGLTEVLVLGVLLNVRGVSTSSKADGPRSEKIEGRSRSLFFAPKLDVMFMPGDRYRPFLTVAAGVGHSAIHVEESLEGSLTAFGVLGGAGVRLFLADGFSLDPAFVLAWSTEEGELRSDAGPDVDIEESGYSVGLRVGLSGWL